MSPSAEPDAEPYWDLRRFLRDSRPAAASPHRRNRRPTAWSPINGFSQLVLTSAVIREARSECSWRCRLADQSPDPPVSPSRRTVGHSPVPENRTKISKGSGGSRFRAGSDVNHQPDRGGPQEAADLSVRVCGLRGDGSIDQEGANHAVVRRVGDWCRRRASSR